tara:strand:+ start:348 stop:557 length:210 start_codon:yes stop_codon:yes gene_type:complete
VRYWRVYGGHSMNSATVNHANEVIEIAQLAMDYTPRIGALSYAIKKTEIVYGVKFNQLLIQYINRNIGE